MPRPRPHPLARALAALLVLVAAFAYPLRLTPGAGGRDLGAFPHARSHGPCPAELREDLGTRPPTPHPSGHGAHCLFCLTGVFALGPDPGVKVTARSGPPAARRAATPHPAYGAPLRARARAPPPASA